MLNIEYGWKNPSGGYFVDILLFRPSFLSRISCFFFYQIDYSFYQDIFAALSSAFQRLRTYYTCSDLNDNIKYIFEIVIKITRKERNIDFNFSKVRGRRYFYGQVVLFKCYFVRQFSYRLCIPIAKELNFPREI